MTTDHPADTSTEFIFGALSTSAGRIQRARTLNLGLQHDAVLTPIDRRPGEPIVITARAGVGLALKSATLCYTIDGTLPEETSGSTHSIALERVAIEWDTLAWAHVETWCATIPSQPADTCVRYIMVATTLDDRDIACPWIGDTASPEEYDQHYLARLLRYGSPRVFEFTVDTETAPDWLRQAVIYQIFVDRFAPDPDRSFADEADLSGFCGGTLRGITSRLDYLRDLGVNCLWLTPIFTSPSHHGYDATDYYAIETRLGSEADLRALIEAAHQRGFRVLLDFVANHLSQEHPAFQTAQRDPASPSRDWFFFKHYPASYACFYDLPDLPIINTDQPAVREYLIGAAQHWLKLGCRWLPARSRTRRDARLLVGVSHGDARRQRRRRDLRRNHRHARIDALVRGPHGWRAGFLSAGIAARLLCLSVHHGESVRARPAPTLRLLR